MRTLSPLCFLLLLLTSCTNAASTQEAFETQVMETAVSAAWTKAFETQTVATQAASSPTPAVDPLIISPQKASQLVLKSMNMGRTAYNTAYSPDGKWLYLPSNKGLYAYDTSTYKNVHRVSTSPYGTFSPSGKILISSNELFLTEGMQKLPALESFSLATDPYTPSTDFFSPDESLLAYYFGKSQANASPGVRVWRLSDGKLINTFEGQTAAISADNHLIAIGRLERDPASQDVRSLIYLYDLQTGQELGDWPGEQPHFLSDNSLVLEANGYTRILDPMHHKTRRGFGGKQAVFSSDEGMVALWERSYINVYRVSDGQLLSRFRLELYRIDRIVMRFSPDGQVLAGFTMQPECCGGSTVNLSLWRVSDGALIKRLRPTPWFVFSPDSQTISVDGREIRRTSDGSLIADLQQTCDSYIDNLVFTPDGQQIILDCYILYLYPASGGSPWVPQKVDRETYLPLVKAASLPNKREVPSPDGEFIARKGEVSNIIVVSSTSGEGREFYIAGANAYYFTFSPDHQLLAVGFRDGSVELWDVNSQKSIYTILPQSQPQASVNALAFSPDGTSLVISLTDGTLRLYGINPS